ncbi:MAG: DMT family transporter [Chloroflexi bacterium]|nr:MAG: DMT family transporter [Chloroflexota bacterium]MBL1196415.1 DMT family transporter [Chloroflexota bacterium]NOH13710.1 DMT family transporter [Chloroflexota bacterium]
MNKHLYTGGAVASGGLLAITIFFNGELARHSSPTWSSLIAHFIGIFGGWFLWRLVSQSKKLFPYSADAPRWSYFGGIFGALIVVIANITVNSSIGLVGSLSLMILGQTCFAILFDYKGWFGMEKRNLYFSDFGQISFILAGSLLIILY